MKHFLLLVVTCCIICSCQQDYLVENIEFTPKLVVNSIFTVGTTMAVEVNSTRNVLDPSSSIGNIETADVVIKDDAGNILWKLNHTTEGHYFASDINIEAGVPYTIEVSNAGYTTVTATSMIPQQVNTSIVNRVLVEGNISDALDVDVQLRDNDTDDNFYVYEVVDSVLINEQSFEFENFQKVRVLLSSEDENQDRIASNRLLQSRVFLTDNKFANGEYNINFKAKTNPDAPTGPVVLTAEKLFSAQKMRVITASENMYEYYKSLEVNRLRGEANSSVAHPVAIYSNISNGLGIFAGYNKEELPLL